MHDIVLAQKRSAYHEAFLPTTGDFISGSERRFFFAARPVWFPGWMRWTALGYRAGNKERHLEEEYLRCRLRRVSFA